MDESGPRVSAQSVPRYDETSDDDNYQAGFHAQSDHGELGVSQQPIVDRGPVRTYPQVRLAQMQDFQGDGNVMFNMFSDQVDELSRFYHWDEQETCRQARAHLSGTMIAYVRCAPFPPRKWEELKTLLMKPF